MNSILKTAVISLRNAENKLIISRLAVQNSSLRKNAISIREQHTQQQNAKNPLMLMDLPRILVPSFLDFLRLRFLTTFRMLSLDPTFRSGKFFEGAQQAVSLISNMISRGDFEALNNLVYENSIQTIKQNYEKLDVSQKQYIAIDRRDIQLQMPYIFDMVNSDSSTYVKLGVLFHVVPGFANDLNDSQNMFSPDPSSLRKKFQEKLMIADYRLVREYRKQGGASDWLVSELNQWKPIDYADEFKNAF